MDLKIVNIENSNTIYWTFYNTDPLNCPYHQRTCDIIVTHFSGNRHYKSMPPQVPYLNYGCKYPTINTNCFRYNGSIKIMESGYYNLYYDINSSGPLKGQEIKILIYSGLFVYEIGNPSLNNMARLRAYYLNVGDILKFTIRNTLLGSHRGTIKINKI